MDPEFYLGTRELEGLYSMSNMGGDRTLYSVRKVDPLVKKKGSGQELH